MYQYETVCKNMTHKKKLDLTTPIYLTALVICKNVSFTLSFKPWGVH